MKKFSLQRFVEPYFRTKNNRLERVKGHLWPSDRYFTNAENERKRRLKKRLMRRFRRK